VKKLATVVGVLSLVGVLGTSVADAQSPVGDVLRGVAEVVDAARVPGPPVVVRPRVFPPLIVPPVPVVYPPAVVPYPWPAPVVAYPVVKRPAAIRIVNPATNTATIPYTLDGYSYVIPPGCVQELAETYVIQFDRGMGMGIAYYGLSDGTYTFTLTSNGSWELFHSP